MCKGSGDVYYLANRPDVVGGKRVVCSACGGKGSVQVPIGDPSSRRMTRREELMRTIIPITVFVTLAAPALAQQPNWTMPTARQLYEQALPTRVQHRRRRPGPRSSIQAPEAAIR